MTAETMNAFKTSEKVRATSGILAGGTREELHKALGSSVSDGNTRVIQRFLDANYPLN